MPSHHPEHPEHHKKTPEQPAEPAGNGGGLADNTNGPQFNEPAPTPDPTTFTVKHGSDKQAYNILDSEKGKLKPRPFPKADDDEPVLKLAAAYGSKGKEIVSQIQAAGQIVFHSVGDTGNTSGPRDQDVVADKMVADYDERHPQNVPSFFYHLGDVVYSFGEARYYYDQFYEPYRDYPAPIFAIAGNHDGMVSPLTKAQTLSAFLDNFCQAGKPPHRTPEAGELARTAQVQPAIYYTLDAPFVKILGIYSNCLEDPGVISPQGHEFPELSDAQLVFLKAALARAKKEHYAGAIVLAVHHPAYVAQIPDPGKKSNAGRHGGSPKMLKDIDDCCEAAGVWPHAVLSGHAHNYQRFTRRKDGRETPFIICGNGGHAVQHLTTKGTRALRTPSVEAGCSDGTDQVIFENYDDQDFGYLRVIADKAQLRIEYHPASDGAESKTPDDFVTVDLKTRKLVHFQMAAA